MNPQYPPTPPPLPSPAPRRRRIKPWQIALIALIPALGFFVTQMGRKSKTTGTLDATESTFAYADTAGIARIFLANKRGETALLERNPQGGWLVRQSPDKVSVTNPAYTARPDAINNLLDAMARLRVRFPVQTKGIDGAITALAENAVKIEIYKTGQALPASVYYIGGATGDQLGTFAMIKGATRPYVIHLPGLQGYLTPRYIADVMEWRSRRLAQGPRVPTSVTIRPTEGSEALAAKALGGPIYGWGIVPQGAGKLAYVAGVPGGRGSITVTNPRQDTMRTKLLAWHGFQVEAIIISAKLEDSLNGTNSLAEISLETEGRARSFRLYAKNKPYGPAAAPGLPAQTDVDRLYLVEHERHEVFMVQSRLIGPLMAAPRL